MTLAHYLRLITIIGTMIVLCLGGPTEAEAQGGGSVEEADTSSTDVLRKAEELKSEVDSRAASILQEYRDRVREINQTIEQKKGEKAGPLRDSLRNLGEDTRHIDSLIATKFRAERLFKLSKAQAKLYKQYARIYLQILESSTMKYAEAHAEEIINSKKAAQRIRRQIKRLETEVDSLEETVDREASTAINKFEEAFGSKPGWYESGSSPADSLQSLISKHKRDLDLAKMRNTMGQKLRSAITAGFISMERVQSASLNARSKSKRHFRTAKELQMDFVEYKRLVSAQGDSGSENCTPIPSDPCSEGAEEN